MQLLYVFISLAAILILLVGNELFWRRRKVHQEIPRKVIHILVGSFAAFWPFFMGVTTIRLITLAFLLAVALSKALNIFASIHEVERFSIGEISFALAVGVLTFVTRNDWIYAAALLQMGLADGLAALIGVHFGKNNSYRVLGHKKSLAGTATFLASSLAIIFIADWLGRGGVSWQAVIVVSVIAAGIENLASWGLDNLLLPVVTALLLTHP